MNKTIARQAFSAMISSLTSNPFFHAKVPECAIEFDPAVERSFSVDEDEEPTIVTNLTGLLITLDNINREGSTMSGNEREPHTILGVSFEELESICSREAHEQMRVLYESFSEVE